MYNSQQNASREGRLEQLQGLHRQVEGEIQENNAQIKLLNNKIVKNDYDRTLLHKLETRQEMLHAKRRELEEIVRTQDFLQKQINQQRNNQNNFKQNLGNQYLQLSEERRRRSQDERRKNMQQQRQMHQYHRRAIQQDQIRRKQQMEEQKRAAMEVLTQRQQMRQRQRQQKQREKEEYNKKVLIRNQIETQKDSVYKQYYNHFMENQDKLQNIYKNKAGVSDRERETQRNQFQRKQIETFQQRVAKEQEEKVIRIKQEKDMLRSFLQGQMEQRTRQKSREKLDEASYHAQVSRYQMNAQQAEQAERMRRKEDQRRYDEDLKQQSRYRSYSYETQSPTRQPHNPITNPIDFKIGITNPYVIREYEQTKEKYLGDNQLKLRNLAMVGSTSLSHQ